MARSAEAIRRRALKRNRTEEDQWRAEREVKKATKEEFFKKRQRSESWSEKNNNCNNNNQIGKSENISQNDKSDSKEDSLKEAGAWECSKCGNHNFASRDWCNRKSCNEVRPSHVKMPDKLKDYDKQNKNYKKKDPMESSGSWKCPKCATSNYYSREVCFLRTCQEARPADIVPPPKSSSSNKKSGKKKPRHDESTSKKLNWAKQADEQTMQKNQDLRKLYLETDGKGMNEADIERAKILIARDERKKQKKEQKKSKKNKQAKDSYKNKNSKDKPDQ